MSERGAAFGPFLLGLGLGAVLGFLFAPEPGEASRTKLSRKLRGLRDLAAEKAGELHELLARLLPSTAGGVPDRAFTLVESALASVVRQRVRLTAVGLPLFLWFSTRLFGGLRAALNEVFDTDERRSWPIAKLLDLAMVFGTGTLLVLGALVATWEARNAGSVSRSFAVDWLWRLSLELTSFAL